MKNFLFYLYMNLYCAYHTFIGLKGDNIMCYLQLWSDEKVERRMHYHINKMLEVAKKSGNQELINVFEEADEELMNS